MLVNGLKTSASEVIQHTRAIQIRLLLLLLLEDKPSVSAKV